MTYFDIGTVQDFTLEPLPPDPKADRWVEMMKFLEDLVLFSFSIKLEDLPAWMIKFYESEDEIKYDLSPVQRSASIIYTLAELQEIAERLKAQLNQQGPLERPTS